MKRVVIFAIMSSLFLGIAGCGPADTVKNYSNPVYEPVFADPSIIRHQGVFYAFGTEDDGIWRRKDGETEYGRRYIPILQSEDLVNWNYAGSVFTYASAPKWGTEGASLWAPDIVYHNGGFILYYSLSRWGDSNPGIGIATAPHPLGPWTDRGMLLTSEGIGVNNSIDASVFKGNDGKLYIIWGSFRGLYGAQLSDDGLSFRCGSQENAAAIKTHIAGLDTSTPWNAQTYEASYIIFKDGYYYMFTSSGTCCKGYKSTYHIKVSRSQNPLGPYIDHEGREMLGANRGKLVLQGNGKFVGTGHNCVVRDDGGNYYIVYHAYDRLKPEYEGNSPRRSLMIDRLLWDKDGWPYVQGDSPSSYGPMPIIKNNK